MSNRNVIAGLAGLLLIVGLVFIYNSSDKASAPKKAAPIPTDSISIYEEDDVSLSQVPNYSAIKAKYGLHLTSNQERFLDQNKFLLLTNSKNSTSPNFDQMLKDFDSMSGGSIYDRRPEDTKLVTPDIVLHAYHKFFEMTLEQLEQKELSAALNDFLISLHDNLASAARNNSGYLKERYQNLEAQIVLARVLFENKSPAKPDFFGDPAEETAYREQDKAIDSVPNAKKILAELSSDLTPELVAEIQSDLEAIYVANSVGSSPLFRQYDANLKTDYTQYTPRSHYNKNSTLRAYFRTMMYLGRSSYFLKEDVGIADSNLLIKQFTLKNADGLIPLESWNKIMTVTGFYAGQSDDLTYNEWQDFQSKILGAKISDNDLVSSDNIKKLTQNLTQLRMPKIFSDIVVSPEVFSQTKVDLLRQSLSFRVFGQRFTFDAWVLNRLTAGQEKTEVRLPSTPSALFVSAALGDLRAKSHLGTFLKKDAGFSNDNVIGFLGKLDLAISDLEKVKKDEWFNSMGSAWLYVLGSLTHNFSENHPRYMRTLAFLDKQIQTFLGSYTELKHDTLLYAKQSYAELGGGGDDRPIPPIVKGFVEPNLDFWNRFSELLNRTEQFFTENKLLANRSPLARLQEFKKIVSFYSDLAHKELQNQEISDDDYEKLRTTRLSFMADPFEAGQDVPDEDSSKVALVADIHTDTLAGQILYEAVGEPYLMLAIVANEKSPRLVASLVFNHYEFTGRLEKRLTDEDWRKQVYSQPEKLPAKNFWYQPLLVK